MAKPNGKAVLITGTSRGIGLELVRQYSAAGWRVIATARAPGKAPELNEIAERHGGAVTVHRLDVACADQIAALALELRDLSLDLLINNAGVYGPKRSGFGETDVEAWLQTLHVNAIAPFKVLEAFADHLAAGGGGIAATLSSRMGSIADNRSGGCHIYRSSKAAVNAVMKSAAIDLAPRGITVVILHPGWVRTGMGGPNGEIDVVESVTGMRAILDRATPTDAGRFFDIDGSLLPW